MTNGRFTFLNTESGKHRTIRLKTQPVDSDWMAGETVVSLLTGPCNDQDFQSFGLLMDGDTTDRRVILWKKHRPSPRDFRKNKWMFYSCLVLRALPLVQDAIEEMADDAEDLTIPVELHLGGNHYEVLVETTCRACGRSLTTPRSIKTGIGPKCAEKEGANG